MSISSHILSLLREERVRVLTSSSVTVKNYGADLLHQSADLPDLLKHHLDTLSADEQYRMAKEKKQSGNTLLHKAVLNSLSLQTVLAIYPENEHKQAIETKNDKGDNVLHAAARYPASLRMLLKHYLPAEQYLAIQEANENDDTVVHQAVPCFESMQTILQICSTQDLFAVLQRKNKAGNTVLHLATAYPATFQVLLKACPKEKLLESLLVQNAKGENIIDLACAGSSKALEMILNELSEEHKLFIINQKNGYGYSRLEWSVHKLDNLKVLLNAIPEAQRLSVILEKGKNGNNLLDKAIGKPKRLRVILQAFPEIDDYVIENLEKLDALNNPHFTLNLLQLFDQIKQLRNHASHLIHDVGDIQAKTEGNKAFNLSVQLNNLLNEYIEAKASSNTAKEDQVRIAFRNQMLQGYKDMNVHRGIWKPIILNLIIAATGIGLWLIIGKYCLTGHFFFDETQRQQQVNRINHFFDGLEKIVSLCSLKSI